MNVQCRVVQFSERQYCNTLIYYDDAFGRIQSVEINVASITRIPHYT